MTNNNLVFYSTKILIELINDILYFPVWWYSRGIKNLLKFLAKVLFNEQKSLALLVWLKNIFQPMYGQYDWQGRIISFFIRLIQIIVRSFVMLFGFILVGLIICFWLLLPFLIINEIIFQLT
ncbi:MAG: hypothetical protein ABH818_02115 [Patescibacteria group bacterium]|nr:hypothetical protein [Patescibacteria group bacterium]MBU1870708.1 hypothetical protein [Patescibacteria group bacterium]